jgi:membrane-bound serine protease (ClpP class)
MSDAGLLLLLYGAGMLVLVAELFIPSHGVLTVVGLGFLIAGIVVTFQNYGERAGAISILACLVVLPVFAFAAIKIWPKTWIGKRIAPPNPIHKLTDTSVPIEEMNRCIGRIGRSLSSLRPVGICEFDGRRISCVAEYGVIEPGMTVEGVRVSGGTLAVRVVQSTSRSA